MSGKVSVVVVGGGPVGLLLAIELKLGGVAVMVLERLPTPSIAIKAPSVGPVGAEALERRGMKNALAEAEDRTFAAMGAAGLARRAQTYNSRGHFALLPIRSNVEPERRMRWVDQQSLETILAKRAAELHIEIRRGCGVTHLEQLGDGIEVRWDSPTGLDHARCSWLVGCDGGRSSVRKMAGFGFTGAPPSLTMYQTILDLDHPERLPRGVTRISEGVLINGPRPRRLGIHDFSGPPADARLPSLVKRLKACCGG